jgi:hypothetical protein
LPSHDDTFEFDLLGDETAEFECGTRIAGVRIASEPVETARTPDRRPTAPRRGRRSIITPRHDKLVSAAGDGAPAALAAFQYVRTSATELTGPRSAR